MQAAAVRGRGRRAAAVAAATMALVGFAARPAPAALSTAGPVQQAQAEVAAGRVLVGYSRGKAAAARALVNGDKDTTAR